MTSETHRSAEGSLSTKCQRLGAESTVAWVAIFACGAALASHGGRQETPTTALRRCTGPLSLE